MFPSNTQSTHGTRVNRINFKKSRCILSNGDRLGFGCTTTNRHLKDVTDVKYHVYRLTNECELKSSEPIDLLDSDDDDGPANVHKSGYGNASFNHEDSEDECPSADEDVKPDVHKLMREVYETRKIKEEVAWNCYEYDRQLATQQQQQNQQNQENQENQMHNTMYNVDLDKSDHEPDICVVEPPQKRQRVEPNEFESMQTTTQSNGFDSMDFQVPETYETTANLNEVASEYQMSDTTLKEKVKIVVHSRGQQLARDMLAAAQAKQKPKPGTIATNMKAKATQSYSSFQFPKNPIPSTSKAPPPSPPKDECTNDHDASVKTVDELKNDFISEITKWDYKWIENKNLNPLQYKLNIQHLDTNFVDLDTFQQFVLN